MDTLRTLLGAYISEAMTLDQFATQYMDYWNDIRDEQNKAIEMIGIRADLDKPWTRYKSGEIDEVTYGMEWTSILNQLHNIRILPHSIVCAIGNEIYNQVILVQEREHIDAQDIPTPAEIRQQCETLLETLRD